MITLIKIMKLFFAFIFTMVVFSFCKQVPAPLTREEVIAVIRKFDEGWKNKDLKEVDEVLAPAYIYFTQSGGLFSRDSVVATAGSPTYTLQNLSRSAYYVELYGNTATVSTRWQGKGVYNGRPFDEDQRCSITVIKLSNKIEILSEHCTPIKPNSIFH